MAFETITNEESIDMTAFTEQITDTAKISHYTGSNAADVAAKLDTVPDPLQPGDPADALRFTPPDQPQHYMEAGQWVRWRDDADLGGGKLVLGNHDTKPSSRFRPLPAAEVRGMGDGAIPAKALGGTQTVQVTLSPAMPSIDYTIVPTIMASPTLLDLGGHRLAGAQIVNESMVNIIIDSKLGSLAGAGVQVLALEKTS